ncbi:MAG TPA: hypothetical protein VNJ54_04975 [Plantibacter sp.]|uniref:hypothetical protein n=1 Tax=unclassified Plantibacter TaxID=2624265 RepID=UPI002BA35987|nr:hypothetical protein [Plantibacter sp.]
MNIGVGATVALVVGAGLVRIRAVVFSMIRAGQPRWVADTQLSLVAQPRVNLALALVMGLCSLGNIILGIGLLWAGVVVGSAAVLAGIGLLVLLGFFVWIYQRPFPAERDA